MRREISYWVALAEAINMSTRRKNEIVVHCFNMGKSIVDFFESGDFLGMQLSEEELSVLYHILRLLPEYTFMVEDMRKEGFEIIDIMSSYYPKKLRVHMKYNSPLVLYIKGDKEMLQEPSIGIVGSRRAYGVSLMFADTMAKAATNEKKVVVSGFAKGVDQQALISTIKCNGRSIIVLPQGIMTFSNGLKKHEKDIAEGRVLVLSTFHPKMPWLSELAIRRNTVIYGLSDVIYVAQSDDTGGTWSGANEGLRNNRPIYVRIPEPGEHSANAKLLQKGAKPIDFSGNTNVIFRPVTSPKEVRHLILQLLNEGQAFTIEEIRNRLYLLMDDSSLKAILADTDYFEKAKRGDSTVYSKASPMLL